VTEAHVNLRPVTAETTEAFDRAYGFVETGEVKDDEAVTRLPL
jgi:hypothetical protein